MFKLKKVNTSDPNETRLDELALNYLERDGLGYMCRVCSHFSRNKNGAKLHLESRHFPTDNGYKCEICAKTFNTKNAFKSHKSTSH